MGEATKVMLGEIRASPPSHACSLPCDLGGNSSKLHVWRNPLGPIAVLELGEPEGHFPGPQPPKMQPARLTAASAACEAIRDRTAGRSIPTFAADHGQIETHYDRREMRKERALNAIPCVATRIANGGVERSVGGGLGLAA